MQIGDKLEHTKRGTKYAVVGISVLSIGPELLTDETVITPHEDSELVTRLGARADEQIGVQRGTDVDYDTIWVLYQGLDRDPDADYPEFWIRPLHEFEGRFTFVD